MGGSNVVGRDGIGEGAPIATMGAALVRAARSGDADAVASLYRRHRAPLLALCERRLGSADAAEDAVQDVFVRALAHLAEFEEGRPFWPWLAAIVERRCVDLRRRAAVREKNGAPAAPDRPPADGEGPLLPGGAPRRARARARGPSPSLAPRVPRGRGPQVPLTAAEGITVGGVRGLVYRARARLRRSCTDLLGTSLPPIRALRDFSVQAAERARRALSFADSQSTAFLTASQILTGLLATLMSVGVGSLGSGSHGIVGSPGPHTGFVEEVVPEAKGFERERVHEYLSRAKRKVPPDDPMTWQDLPELLVRDLEDGANPNANVHQPEDAGITDIAISPTFERDGTMFAVGRRRCLSFTCPSVLFRSTDGGATWTRFAADGLRDAWRILLPPNFGRGDDQILPIANTQLHVSKDGGASFIRVASPPVIAGDASIAPTWGTKGCSFITGCGILLGSSPLSLYDDDLEVIGPSAYGVDADAGVTYPAYSPDYGHDDLVVISGDRMDEWTRRWWVLHRCVRGECTSREPGLRGTPEIRMAPDFARSGLAYAFTEGPVFVSHDRARTFSDGRYPWGDPSLIHVTLADLEPAEDGVVFAAVWQIIPSGRAGIYVSRDAGLSWTLAKPVWKGAHAIAVSGSYVLAATSPTGLTCSADGGRTWAPRCPRS